MLMSTMKRQIAFIDRNVDDLVALLAGIRLGRLLGAEAATAMTGQE